MKETEPRGFDDDIEATNDLCDVSECLKISFWGSWVLIPGWKNSAESSNVPCPNDKVPVSLLGGRWIFLIIDSPPQTYDIFNDVARVCGVISQAGYIVDHNGPGITIAGHDYGHD